VKSWSPIIGHIIFAARRPKRAVKALYFRGLGLGYIKRRITGGPIKGLWLVAGKRIFYSKSFWNGTYEKDACRFIQRVVPVNGVCYDIGANIGYHTLIMARSVGNDGLVYAFECIPNVCDVLRRNANINGIGNVVIVKKVVSRGSGTLTLTRNIGIDQASLVDLSQEKLSTKIKNNPLLKTITCPAIKIDDFVTEGNRPPSFVKIDVEGAEVDVLAGAANTLKTHQPMVLCETHGRNRAHEVYKTLAGLGYELFCVTENMVPIQSMAQVPTNMQEGHLFARMKKT
jgi:FkbM family methyltransferase